MSDYKCTVCESTSPCYFNIRKDVCTNPKCLEIYSLREERDQLKKDLLKLLPIARENTYDLENYIDSTERKARKLESDIFFIDKLTAKYANDHNPDVGKKVDGWMPIESAPKDGTEIIAWREDAGQMMARYTSAEEFCTSDELDQMDEESIFSKDWFCADYIQGCRLDGDLMPTHWQPKPPEKVGE